MPSAPTDSSWPELELLFHQALDLDGPARAAFLEASCGGDRRLRDAVQELLAASAAAARHTFWQTSALENEARQLASEDRDRGAALVPRYRLLERIGTGGMGLVYRAVRDDDAFQKQVAVKIVQRGIDNDALVRRFHRERQVLARLEHPHIARLLDGGATFDGLPFLVMEYVDGVSIDRDVAERKPPLRERLQMFLAVCSAISYAHRNLVVHLDLKPGNILVAAGVPKVLDFGIARMLDSPGGPSTSLAMTPQYASPEQLRDGAITTASDIYSLGVILYELLAETSPYPATGLADLARQVCDRQPDPPGSRSPHRFGGDLDVIVLQALRKEPERRYASVDLLAEDVRRYLGGYTISARPDTAWYRASRFLSRHRVPASLAALSAVTVIALGAGLAAQWKEGQRRYRDIRALSGRLVFEVYDSIRDVPGALRARARVAEIAGEYLARLANERDPDDGLRLELGTAFRKLGDIQGEPYSSSLGATNAAMESLLKARRLLEGARRPDTLELAAVYQEIGRILVRQGKPREAIGLERKAVSMFEALLRPNPAEPAVALKLAWSLIYLGQSEMIDALAHPAAPAFEPVKRDYLRAAALFESIAGPEASYGWAVAERHVAYALWTIADLTKDAAMNRDAAAHTARAVQAAEAAAAAAPNSLNKQWQLSGACRDHGTSLMRLGDIRSAAAFHQRGLDGLLRLLAQEPENREIRREVADTHVTLGAALSESVPRTAVAHYQAALAIYEEFLRANPGDLENATNTVAARDGLAAIFLRTGRAAEAADLYRRTLALIAAGKAPESLKPREQALLQSAITAR